MCTGQYDTIGIAATEWIDRYTILRYIYTLIIIKR